MIATTIIIILTIAIIIYTLSLPEQKGSMVAKIICFLIHGCLVAGFYGLGAFTLIKHYLNIERLGTYDNMPLGGPGVEFAWILFVIGLFLLRQWLGVIFNRDRTVWYSD